MPPGYELKTTSSASKGPNAWWQRSRPINVPSAHRPWKTLSRLNGTWAWISLYRVRTCNVPVTLLSLLLFTWVATAKERQWQDATVVDISYNSSNGGTATIPVGGITATVPITVNRIVYRISTQDTTYIFVLVNKKHPLNLTLHGKTKIAVDGSNAHILDDGGKDVKVPIVQKIANAPAQK
jgi:hypothetical protein